MTVRKWGEETLVNTNVTGDQGLSTVTALTGGGYVISWFDSFAPGGDGNSGCTKFQRYDAAGNKVGGETIANFAAAGNQINQGVVGTDDGGFVIVWSDSETEYRRFDANGVALDATDRALVLVGGQSNQAVAPLDSGFAIAFTDEVAGNKNIRVQRFLANGDTAGGLINVAASANIELSPAIAELAGGGFVVAWEDNTTERIRVRGFDAAGVETFAALNVSDAADTQIGNPSITALANGAFVVTWSNSTPIFPDTDTSVRARIVSSSGVLIGNEFIINTLTSGAQNEPNLAALPNGGFVAVYGSDDDIRGQVFDSFGARDGGEFVINTSTDGGQSSPSIAVLADGRFVVTWREGVSSHLDDPGSDSVRQQIFDPRDGFVTGTANADTLFGHDLSNDEINGLGGADTLNGLGGSDSLYGGDGGDTYIVGAGDQVFETSAAGTDLVQASVSFGLGANLENLTLTGAAAVNGTGNALANVITGNAAANVITGGLGTDTLNGGLGNDTYVLENGADTVSDSGGIDTITSTITRSLTGFVTIENLTLLGTAVTNATGNGLANVLTGNNANNVLDGLAGADTMIGLAGNDTYFVDSALDTVSEAGGTGTDRVLSSVTFSLAAPARAIGAIENLTLTGTFAVNGTGNTLANIILGNAAANTLTGGIGNDLLRGLAGNDTLTGGIGIDNLAGGANNDFFIFDAPLSAANRDVIIDFNHVEDTFRLENSVMTALGGPGALAAGKFFAGAAAHDADDRIIYNQAAGALTYDSNGNAAGGVTLLATLTNKPANLAANDFVVT